ncbi:MAG: hypothetical protein L6427_09805 [Actinomycetia bacterium]|nr:hypothetical protein [Actinomycetota bacterium]MCG2796137.1 hypothetical protein [Actinomycetes bacterium]
MNSDYTDLESAKKAGESFETSSRNDQEAVKKLDALQKPDEDACQIAKELREGILQVDEGNAKAPEQTVEERQATSADFMPVMTLYVESVTKIVASLADLKKYVESNDLESVTAVGKWLDQIKSELEEVKKYITQ